MSKYQIIDIRYHFPHKNTFHATRAHKKKTKDSSLTQKVRRANPFGPKEMQQKQGNFKINGVHFRLWKRKSTDFARKPKRTSEMMEKFVSPESSVWKSRAFLAPLKNALSTRLFAKLTPFPYRKHWKQNKKKINCEPAGHKYFGGFPHKMCHV